MIPDLEKVASGLRHCLHYNGSCLDCPYDGPNCQNDVLDDALVLLKAQEPKLVRIEEDSVHCPSCGNELFTYPRQKFCDECGQEVKWEE